MTELLEFFAPCPRGTERFLADELRELKCARIRPLVSGVSFAGDLATAYRALLWSRIASRVLLTLARVPAATADELYAAVGELPWEDHVRANGTIAVDATGTNEALRNTQFTAVRVKDAIADRFTARYGRRPNVDTAAPDLLVNVVVRAERATISIDLAGEPLHRRGYREAGVQVAAPMKETLAAAVLAAAGWRDIARAGGSFLDPLCGSGTLAIEAALVAGDVAPGLTRRRWGFEGWLRHDADAWAAVLADAERRRDAGMASVRPISGSDSDARAIEIARAAARRAGLEGVVRFERRPLSALPPALQDVAHGLVATNPPYGERIQAHEGLPALYADLARVLAEGGYAGWTLAVITPDESLERGLGMRAERTHDLYNGRILSPVRVFVVGRSEPLAAVPRAGVAASGAPEVPAALPPDAQAFANRLRKMAKHHEKWARRSGIGCYRVYDADLPDYAVAIDVYAGSGPDEGKRWAHVAEYAPPPGIDPDRAARRLEDVRAIVPEVLGVAPADVFVKTRQRQRGTAQYERVSEKSVTGVVSEGGLLFEVNFSDYLDTGLFLDHRLTREWIRELAPGTRFLNLFAYTGTASVYAAAGGASATTTVDLSATYLSWAERNLVRNGFSGPNHRRVREDVLRWIDAAGATPAERFELIFCDPPTFSNSKRMAETWDVQRDHVRLIESTAKLLAPGGLLVFSCNRKGFAMDVAALDAAGLACEDVTARTIPRDFERRPGVHACWTVRRREG